jgi:hypothetical protein
MERREPAQASLADRRAAERDARLAAALRANLRRRKAQTRARQDAADGDAAPKPSTDTVGGDRA